MTPLRRRAVLVIGGCLAATLATSVLPRALVRDLAHLAGALVMVGGIAGAVALAALSIDAEDPAGGDRWRKAVPPWLPVALAFLLAIVAAAPHDVARGIAGAIATADMD